MICSCDAVEVADELGDIVVVVFFLLWLGSTTGGSGSAEGGLEELVLLGTNLLQDVGQHRLECLGLGIASDNEQTLPDGEGA